MRIDRWIRRRLWGRGRTVRYVFRHPTCGQADVEMAYLPEWGCPRFLCRRCGVAFDEAAVRLAWQGDQALITGEGPAVGGPSPERQGR